MQKRISGWRRIISSGRGSLLERPRDGIAKAEGEGKYKGRAPTARAKTADIHRLAVAGATRESIAAQLGVGVRSVYRVTGAGRVDGAATFHPRSRRIAAQG